MRMSVVRKKKKAKDDRRNTYWGEFQSNKKDKSATLDRKSSVAVPLPQRRALSERRGSKWKSRFQRILGKQEAIISLEMLSGWQRRETLSGTPYYLELDTRNVCFDKPEILKSEKEKEDDVAEWVWVPHPKNVWQPAKVKCKTNEIQVVTLDNVSMKIPHIRIMKGKHTGGVSQQVPLWPLKKSSLDRIEDDLVALPSLNEGLILHNLRLRYENNDIYTWVGANRSVLISINPFQDLPLYSTEQMDMQRSKEKSVNITPPPHVFAIANDSLEALLFENKSQSILVSGESGAGKTHSTKQCLDFLAHVAGSDDLDTPMSPGTKRSSRRQSNTQNRFMMTMMAASSGTNPDQKVEQKVLVANPVLEAFGNAKTVRNNNSSRFGKFIAVYIDRHDRNICGAQITSFLLEGTRVAHQSQNERNYHIFYQLLSTPDICERYMLEGGAESFHYVNQSGCISVDGTDDEEEFEQVIDALEQLGIDEDEQEWMIRTSCAILHLGNISFDEVKLENGTKGCKLLENEDTNSRQALERTAELLEIDCDALEKVLTKRSITVRGEHSIIPLKKIQAIQARDSLAKAIYAKMFDWLVNRVNEAFGEVTGKFIGILDIFGFEMFEHNSFEQLCINYANERLQQIFNQHTFNDEEDLYKLEQINYKHVEFQDNQPVLDLIDKRPNGILNLLDDECVVPGGSDTRLMGRIEAVHKDNRKVFKSLGSSKSSNKSVKRASCDALAFSVTHFAGKVVYDLRGFMEKNSDNLFQDLYDICSQSQDELTQDLFPTLNEYDRIKVISQSAKFRGQLVDLMTILNKTESRYIRCIKPNKAQAPNDFEGRKCLEQLKASGVFGCVEIRKTGYPFRLYHEDFAAKYRCINPGYTYKAKNNPDEVKQLCREILEASPQKFGGVQIGEMRVMFRVEDHKMLELLRDLALSEMVPKIQSAWRMGIVLKLRKRVTEAEQMLQNAVAEKTNLCKLETAIDETAEIIGEELQVLYPQVKPPSLSKAEKLLAGLEQWEKIEEEMEEFLQENKKRNPDKERGQEIIARADQLKLDEGIFMTESQMELYDEMKEVLLNEKIEDLEEKVEEALEVLTKDAVLAVHEEHRAKFATSNEKLDEVSCIAIKFKEMEANAARAIDLVDHDLLEMVLKEANDLNHHDDTVAKIEQLLSLDEKKFVELEIESATRWRDQKRLVHRELRILEFNLAEQFRKYNDFFSYEGIRGKVASESCSTRLRFMKKKSKQRKNNGLKKGGLSFLHHGSPADVVMVENKQSEGDETVSLDQGDSAENEAGDQEEEDDEVKFTSRSIKTSVLHTRNKYHIQLAVANFKNIQIYMGDHSSSAGNIPKREKAGLQVLRLGLENSYLRNEIFAQILMQLTGNKNPESVVAGIDLLCLSVTAFSPNDTDSFIKFFIVWIKLHLSRDHYSCLVSVLHDHGLTAPENQELLHDQLVQLISLEGESSLYKNYVSDEGCENEADKDSPGLFTIEASDALDVIRDRFKSFLTSGSRFSKRHQWETDPFESIEDFSTFRRLLTSPKVHTMGGIGDLDSNSNRSDSTSTGSEATTSGEAPNVGLIKKSWSDDISAKTKKMKKGVNKLFSSRKLLRSTTSGT